MCFLPFWTIETVKQCIFFHYYFTRNSRLIFLLELLKYVMVYSAVFDYIYTKCLAQNLIIKEKGKTLSSTVLFDNGWLVVDDASNLVGH